MLADNCKSGIRDINVKLKKTLYQASSVALQTDLIVIIVFKCTYNSLF